MGAPRWQPPGPKGGKHGRWLVEFRARPTQGIARKVRRFPAADPSEKAKETARREAARWAADYGKGLATREMLDELGLALPDAPDPATTASSTIPTFRASSKRFLQWLVDSQAAPRTITAYTSQLKTALIKPLGKLPLDQITPAVVDKLAAGLRARGKTPEHVLHVLSSMMSWAVDEHLIPSNPCRRERPRYRMATAAPKPQPRTHTREQRQVLYETIPADELLVRGAVVLAGWCGLRAAECLGVQPGDLDPAAGLLHVERQAQRNLKGPPQIRPPKYNSQRIVPVGDWVLEQLRPLLARAEELELEYLLQNPDGTWPMWHRHPQEKMRRRKENGEWRYYRDRGDALQRWLALGSKAAGIDPPATLRSLRATAYTRWLERYLPVHVEVWIGHRATGRGRGVEGETGMTEVGAKHYFGGLPAELVDRAGLN